MKRTLTIRVRWAGGTTLEDGTVGVWFAHDDTWAYGTGNTPEAAVVALFETLRDVMKSTTDRDGWEQGVAYAEWLGQEKAS